MTRVPTLCLAALVAALCGAAGDDLDPADPSAWLLPHADLYGLAVRGEKVWAVGYWGTVLRSEDGGTTWSQVGTDTDATLYAVDFADQAHGWAVGAFGTLLGTTDGGRSWRAQASGVDTHLFAVSAVSAQEAWAVGDLGVLLHVRDGATWQRVELPEDVFGDEETPERIFNGVRFSDALHGWVVGEFGTRLRSDDGGHTWSDVSALEGAPTDIYLYGVDADGAQRVAAAGLAGRLVVSDDGGRSWHARRIDTSAPLFDVVWQPGRGVVVGDRGELYLTNDAGGTWVSPERPRIFRWLTAVRGDGGVLFVVGEKGLVLRSRDGGASWSQVR